MLVAPAQAHHSVASEYNVKQLTPMTGVLEKLELVKPHPWMFVDVKAADGSVQTWQLEFSLRWRPSSMVIGQSYKMIVMPARYTKQKAFIVELTFPDGTKFSRAS
jgi:hypothetical protein